MNIDELKPIIEYKRPNPDCQNCDGTGAGPGPGPCGRCWTYEFRLMTTDSKGSDPIVVHGLLFRQVEQVLRMLDAYGRNTHQYCVWDENGNIIATNNPGRFEDGKISKQSAPVRPGSKGWWEFMEEQDA